MKTAVASSVHDIAGRPYASEPVQRNSCLAGPPAILPAVLDGPHKNALRAVASGTATEEHAPAIRNLSLAGLIQPIDGAWTLTQPGHAVLELEGAGGGAAGGAVNGVEDLKSKIRDWFMT